MTEEAKPREFWLNKEYINDKYEFFSCEIASRKPNTEVYEESDFKDAIHVIEYSAYKQLEADNAELEKDLDTIRNYESSEMGKGHAYIKELHNENAALKARIEKLREALIALSDNSDFCMGEYIGPNKDFTLMADVTIARAALKEDDLMST